MAQRQILQLPGTIALAVGLLFSQPADAGRRRLVDSPHLAEIPPPGPCDVVITPANQDTTLPMLNDPDKRVFCVNPGNYRRQLHLKISRSGTPNARRYLRYNAPFPAPLALDQPKRAVFHGLVLSEASYWVIEGITVQPLAGQNLAYLVAIFSGSNNILHGNYLDASRQPNHKQQRGVLIGANRNSGPSADNVIQRNVIRGGNLNRIPVDYTGVSILDEDQLGSFNSYNKIVDNEIYDWGDGVQISADPVCSSLKSWAKGTVIDGNDIYIRKSKYVDCETGVSDPRGECSCSENGIDIKSPAGPNPRDWTQVTNNRLWGFRPTLKDVQSCGGSGAKGSAINAGGPCAAHVFVGNNVVTDSTAGVVTEGSDWRVIGNLLYDIGNLAIFPDSDGTRVQFNTVVNVANAYSDTGAGVVAVCNAVINDQGTRGEGAPRGEDHVVKFNDLYQSSSPDLESPTTKAYPLDYESRNALLCVERMRFTRPDDVCIPFGRTTDASPHLAQLPPACNNDPGATFGLSGLSYP